MKRTIFGILLATTILFACNAGGSKDKDTSSEPSNKDLSYALGMALGSDLKTFEIPYDYNEFLKGFKDMTSGKEPKVTLEEAMMTIQLSLTAIMEKQAEANRLKEEQYMAENGKKPGIVTTASGLQYEVLTQGSGPNPTAEQVVVVNYVGTLAADGTKFDSSYDRNEPAEFPLNYVIPGWTEGIQLMNVGSKYRFYIPSALGYGPQGAGNGAIPPYAALIFEVELLEIKELDPEMFNFGY